MKKQKAEEKLKSFKSQAKTLREYSSESDDFEIDLGMPQLKDKREPKYTDKNQLIDEDLNNNNHTVCTSEIKDKARNLIAASKAYEPGRGTIAGLPSKQSNKETLQLE